MLDPNFTGIIVVGILALVPIVIVTVTTLSKTKLRIEQIRADAMVRAEEVKAKNQLEIEKLIYGQTGNMHNKKPMDNKESLNFESDDNRQVRERERL